MRLLNTQTHVLKTFYGDNIPPYAILSHTWRPENDEEILFNDIQQPFETWQIKAAFTKVQGFCAAAASDGFEWVWIDTCCIDKSSSAELSEAINSMYSWYGKADVCYVYLEDVEFKSTRYEDLDAFKSSRWFSRGWTLQELLAPHTVEFYDRNWREFGTKKSLQAAITERTRIRREILVQLEEIPKCTIAERMSWAADRNATREEDIAYCLFGIFDIHMPLQYGEGKKAFQRLQDEIFKVSEDYTWLAWTIRSPKNYSVFATSPSSFVKPINQECWSQSSSIDMVLIGEPSRSQLPSVEKQTRSTVPWDYSQLQFCKASNRRLNRPRIQSLLTESEGPTLDEFPRLTPRGLRLTLPIIKTTSYGLLAYLNCICMPAGQLVCLALSKESSRSGDTYKRDDKGVILISDEELSIQYKLLYLKINATSRDTMMELIETITRDRDRLNPNQTLILSIGANVPVLLLYHVAWNATILYHFVMRYASVDFHLLFGLQNGGWCYFAIDQDHAFLPGQTYSLVKIIAKNIANQESDRAEVVVEGTTIYCKIKQRSQDWMRSQARRYGLEYSRGEDSTLFSSIDVYASPDTLGEIELIRQERIDGVNGKVLN